MRKQSANARRASAPVHVKTASKKKRTAKAAARGNGAAKTAARLARRGARAAAETAPRVQQEKVVQAGRLRSAGPVSIEPEPTVSSSRGKYVYCIIESLDPPDGSQNAT